MNLVWYILHSLTECIYTTMFVSLLSPRTTCSQLLMAPAVREWRGGTVRVCGCVRM